MVLLSKSFKLRSVGWFLLPLVFSLHAPQAPRAQPLPPGRHSQMSAEVPTAAQLTRRTLPGETVRVVRFNVKPEERESFERFFWESLRPAAAKRAGVQLQELDLGGFRLLIPSRPNPHGYLTYYVLVDPAGGPLGAGEVMRDMVREAFPGEEGQERVRRWMTTMVLEAPFAPAGEDFVEADLRKPRVSAPGRDQVPR